MHDPSDDIQEPWIGQEILVPRSRNWGLIIGLVALILALAAGLAWTLFERAPGGVPPGPAGAMGPPGTLEGSKITRIR
jgi:hypothetical protein